MEIENYSASKTEQETFLNYDPIEKRWHLFTDIPWQARRYERFIPDKLVKQKGYRNGNLVMIEGYLDDDTLVSIRKRPHFTAEQLKMLSERMRKIRNKQSD